jgi:hypothetical protein
MNALQHLRHPLNLFPRRQMWRRNQQFHESNDSETLPQIENVARIRSSVARSTSVSIDGLKGLTSELRELQTLLDSEVERVQGEIESALSGIEIIMETIAPWKSASVSPAPPTRGPTSFSRDGLKSRDQG